jgi:hypothetical protein
MSSIPLTHHTRRDRLSDWAVIVLVIAALIGGWLVKTSAENATQLIGGDVGSFSYPAGWLADTSTGLTVQDTRTASGVPTAFSLSAEPLDGDPSLNALSTGRTIRLAQELDGFSMLSTKPDNVNGESAVTLNYAYVVVPEAGTAGSARLPVVVEATDTLLKHSGQLVVVRFSSDSQSFAALADRRAQLISSVKLP